MSVLPNIVLFVFLLFPVLNSKNMADFDLSQPQVPLLTGKDFNPALKIIPRKNQAGNFLEEVKIKLEGTSGLNDIENISLFYSANPDAFVTDYDVRRESSRDLQGNIDIGLSRSTDGGNTWEPMKIVLDQGTWGGLPQKYNGVSDPCILADPKTGKIYLAALWTYGVLDKNGKWIAGLNDNSTEWNHQWRERGSQPGFDLKETTQFLLIQSADDGLSWTEPVNLTKMCKKKEWWLFAPAPGHGITLSDGTMVFPAQGRDENGESFSTIVWGTDSGKSWQVGNPASHNTTENMAVQLTDGSIMLNIRDNRNKQDTTATNGRAVFVTRDLGKTWQEHPSSHDGLIEPTCMASIHKHSYTKNGTQKNILLFSNPDSKTTRKKMSVKLSFDDGKTWPEDYWILLGEMKGRGYSCITSIDEKTIGILYESSQADLVFQKISLDELLKK